MAFDHYFLLGRSGLRVSRLALGTMTFGNAGIRGIGGSWGTDEDNARAIVNRYGSGWQFHRHCGFLRRGSQ